MIVTVDRFVAWLPRPTSSAGMLELEIEMSPISEVRGSTPVQLTYDRWKAGERFDGGRTVAIPATCGVRNPAAPGYRRIPPPGR